MPGGNPMTAETVVSLVLAGGTGLVVLALIF